MKTTTLIAIFLLIPVYLFAELSGIEQKIATEALSYSADAISLLEKVANINSGTMNADGVRQVGTIFMKEFDSIDFETRWIDLPREMNRAGHLVAQHTGSSGKRLLLIGHLDTVFEIDSPWAPFQRKDSIATGQGVLDDKGGDVVILFALKALNHTDALQNSQIIVLLTGDEENPGEPLSISRKDLIEAGKQSDVALGFEAAIGMDTGTIARRGICSWKLTVKGKQAHSSGVFSSEDGFGAIYEASRILNAFQKELSSEQYLTLNPGFIVGGTDVTNDSQQSRGTALGKTNVIAQTAIVEGDLRFISTEQQKTAQKKMTAIVTQGNLPLTTATIEFMDSYPPMPPTEGNKELLKVFGQASIDLGIGKVEAYDPGGRGAGDISFVASDLDALDGLGLVGKGSHTTEEEVDLNSIGPQIQRAAILIYRLIQMR